MRSSTVSSGFDHGHVVDALQLRDRALGDQDRALLLVDGDADAGVLAGPDDAAGVGEGGLHQDRARLGVDRAVHEHEVALLGMHRPVGEDQLELEGSRCSRRGASPGAARAVLDVVPLGDADADVDRRPTCEMRVSSVLCPRPTSVPG